MTQWTRRRAVDCSQFFYAGGVAAGSRRSSEANTAGDAVKDSLADPEGGRTSARLNSATPYRGRNAMVSSHDP
ncbi:hypothetical protein RISK_006339 [Rhodopirellula islandica]|uniref:Uncharacterized protein n=1 Tax=Rhodopirellula islandica TaxID=595434 RepID=A0A0J1B4S7_RHOIS|nr:hypothetical protein RISK_006339 [Rhodopirellula islandica]